MATEVTERHERIVERYFEYVRGLRTGEEGSVERLVDMWDEDGTFEFAGSPPVAATFCGRNAIHTLYKNRFQASGMPLQLQAVPEAKVESGQAQLGEVRTEVRRTRRIDRRIVAGWVTRIGTRDGRGFQVHGSHAFTFEGDRISTLKVIVSPRPEQAESLDLGRLNVDDIGRLSLAAWAVV